MQKVKGGGQTGHMKKLNGLTSSVGPLCWIDSCELYDTCTNETCWIYDTCGIDYTPPCKFIDRCGEDY